jgi:hypothetical protein
MDRLGVIIALSLEVDASPAWVLQANHTPHRAPFLSQRVGDHLRLLVLVHSLLNPHADPRGRHRQLVVGHRLILRSTRSFASCEQLAQ